MKNDSNNRKNDRRASDRRQKQVPVKIERRVNQNRRFRVDRRGK